MMIEQVAFLWIIFGLGGGIATCCYVHDVLEWEGRPSTTLGALAAILAPITTAVWTVAGLIYAARYFGGGICDLAAKVPRRQRIPKAKVHR